MALPSFKQRTIERENSSPMDAVSRMTFRLFGTIFHLYPHNLFSFRGTRNSLKASSEFPTWGTESEVKVVPRTWQVLCL